MSLLKSGAALSFARLANQAVMFIGPIILVRLLSIQEYGVYREFFIYATIAGVIGCAAVNRSLLYFLPKYPQSEKRLVILSTAFVLFFSSLVATSFVLLTTYGGVLSDFNFSMEVALYLIVFLNFDYVECLWLAKGKISKVIIYTLLRSGARLVVAVYAAYYFRTAEAIVWSLIAIESLRLAYVLISTAAKYRVFKDTKVEPQLGKQQAIFFAPLAMMASLEAINLNIGQLIVSSELGDEALALYFVGSYALLIANLLYSSVSDLLFPKVVELASDDHRLSMQPWRHMTNFYLIVMLAVTTIGYAHAVEIISLLFSDKYVAAAPVFQVLVFGTLILSFDFNFVIRTMNKNTNSLVGYSILIPVNLGVSFLLISKYALLAPAYAYLFAQAVLAIYLGWRVLALTKLPFAHLFEWSQMGRIVCAFGAALFVFYTYLSYAPTTGYLNVCASSLLFLVAYLGMLKISGVNTLQYFASNFGNAEGAGVVSG